MALEFSGIEFQIRGRGGDPDIRWCWLSLEFKDTEIGHKPSVDARIPVKVHPELSIAEVGALTRGHAMTILREALDVLEANELTELEKQHPL